MIRRKAAIGAAESDGGNYESVTLTELMRLTRIELCDLMAQIANILRTYPEGSVEQNNAIINLRNIARILSLGQ